MISYVYPGAKKLSRFDPLWFPGRYKEVFVQLANLAILRHGSAVIRISRKSCVGCGVGSGSATMFWAECNV